MNNIIEDYKEIVLGLSDILEIENDLLQRLELQEASKMIEQKNKAIIAYRGSVAKLIQNQDVLENISDKENDELRVISQDLDDLLKENDIILKTRMETSQSVIDSIVGMMKMSNASSATSYGSQGVFSPLEKSKNAITINETL